MTPLRFKTIKTTQKRSVQWAGGKLAWNGVAACVWVSVFSITSASGSVERNRWCNLCKTSPTATIHLTAAGTARIITDALWRRRASVVTFALSDLLTLSFLPDLDSLHRNKVHLLTFTVADAPQFRSIACIPTPCSPPHRCRVPDAHALPGARPLSPFIVCLVTTPSLADWPVSLMQISEFLGDASWKTMSRFCGLTIDDINT